MTTSEAREAPDAFDVDVSSPSVEGSRCPWPMYQQLRERGPVVRVISVGGITAYAVTRYDAVQAGFQDRRFAKDASHLAVLGGAGAGRQAGFVLSTAAKHLLNSDPPDHTRLKTLVARAFTPRRVQELRPRIQEIVDGLLDSVDPTGEADLIGDFSYPLSITVICELLGVPSERRAEFREWSVSATTPPTSPEAAEGGKKLQDFLTALIAQRRGELAGVTDPAAAPDVLSAMILAHEEGDQLSDAELLGMSFLLLIAGHETTAGLIGSSLLELCRHRDQRQLLIDEPDLIGQALEEFLRYEGSVQRATFRVAVEDVELGGTVIPAGSVVTMMVGSANHDPDHFADPDTLDITRSAQRHLAFGQGIHFCLGAPLARLEAQVAISTMLRRFPEYELSVAEDALAYQPTVIRALTALPVRLGPSRTG